MAKAQWVATVLVEMQRHPDGRSDSEELPMLPSLESRCALQHCRAGGSCVHSVLLG